MRRMMMSLMLLLPLAAAAFDFSAVVPGGQTLYFSIVDNGVQVVYPNTSADPWGGYARPAGALTVPASVVSPGGTTYAVVSVGLKALQSTYITSLTLEEGIAEVGANACYYCEHLAEVHLPASLTSLGASFVMMCDALTDVYMSGSAPPAATSAAAFNQSAVSTATLHIPCGSAAAYNVAPWSLFGTVDQSSCSVTITTAVSDPLRGSVAGSGIYATGTQVVLTATPSAGFAFVCWSDADTLNPRIVHALADSHFVAIFQRPVHDTVTLRDTVTLHDTILVPDTLWRLTTDTLFLTDTLLLRDTLLVQPTFFRLQVQGGAGGIGIGSAVLPAGTEVEVGALPLEGFRFAGWADGGADNPRRVTVVADAVYEALFEPQAVGLSAAEGWSLSVDGRLLEVRCAEGEPIRIYDGQGRAVASLAARAPATRLVLPAAGVFIVQVGGSAGRKVAVR